MTMITGITFDNWGEYQKKVKLDTGITMSYVEAGNTEAPVLVLIHGFTDTGRVWQYMLQFLEKDFHIYMPDLRGHGDSDKPVQNIQTVPEYAGDVIAFMKALGLEGGFVAGHSLGAITAQTIGYLEPDIAGKIMNKGMGLLVCIIVGIVGGLLGSWVFSLLGLSASSTFWGQLLVGTVGAVVLLWLVSKIKKK